MNDTKTKSTPSEPAVKHRQLQDSAAVIEPLGALDGAPLMPNEGERVSAREPLAIRMPVDVRGASISVLAIVALIWLLRSAQQVVIPFVLSGLLFYALDPVVDRLQRWKVPRTLGTAFVLLSVVGCLMFTAYSVSDEAMAVMEELPAGLRKVRNELNARRGQPGALENVRDAAQALDQTAAEATGRTSAPQGVVRVQVEETGLRASDYLWSGSMGAVGLVGLGLMILFLTYFLLVANDLFKRKLVKNIGSTLSRKKSPSKFSMKSVRRLNGFCSCNC